MGKSKINEEDLRTILKKASEIEFGNAWGDCLLMTLSLTRYLKEEYGVELKAHIGALVGEEGTTLHMWNSYKGKMIDLTAHKQRGETAQSFILDTPISEEGNSKRVVSYKINSEPLRDFARNMAKYAEEKSPESLSISHIFLKYERAGKIPYDDIPSLMDTESRRNNYEKFKSYMNQNR